MVGRRVPPGLSVDDMGSYIKYVKSAFHDEPAKYEEFFQLMIGLRDHRLNNYSVVARVEELMKDHQNLLLGFNVFLPAEAARTMHHEAKEAEQRAKSADTKKNHADAEDFMNKLKTRFGSLDTHVVESFRKIMNVFKARKMSVKEMHKEVVDILYYHEDLIGDFCRLSTKNDPVASASLLLQL